MGARRLKSHYAARVLQPALAPELIARGAHRHVRDASGKTPLDIAREPVGQNPAPLLEVRGWTRF
jgi:hypothetical protein